MTKDWLLERDVFSHVRLLDTLQKSEPVDYKKYLRMPKECYFELLELVTPLILKEDTNMRKAVTPHERLAATLRFLATGQSYSQLQFSTRISRSALGKIIPETCEAIISVLKDEYLKVKKRILY